jgi:hypothetical protein
MAALKGLLRQQQFDLLALLGRFKRFALGTHAAQRHFLVLELLARNAAADQQGLQRLNLLAANVFLSG